MLLSDLPLRRPQRLVSLDMLRALAVTLVIGHHTAFRFIPPDWDVLAGVFKHIGWIGVDIFFVISGFMITRVLMRDHGDTMGFFRRRFFRIVPIFAVAVIVFVIASLVTGVNAELLHRIWSPALLLNGWTIPFFGYDAVPYTIVWSLSVEETAYILMGLASVTGLVGLKWMILAMFAVGPITRSLVVQTGYMDLFDLYFFVPARLDAIAFGAIAALGVFSRLANRSEVVWISGVGVIGLILIFQSIPIDEPFMPLIGYSLFSLVMAIFVAAVVLAEQRSKSSLGRSLPEQWAISFGQLSYFVYLFHLFVIEFILIINRAFLNPIIGFWPAFLLAIALVHIAAVASWKYFEYPLIQFGRRG